MAVVIIMMMTSVGNVLLNPSCSGRRAGIFTPIPRNRKSGKKASSFSLSLHYLAPGKGGMAS